MKPRRPPSPRAVALVALLGIATAVPAATAEPAADAPARDADEPDANAPDAGSWLNLGFWADRGRHATRHAARGSVSWHQRAASGPWAAPWPGLWPRGSWRLGDPLLTMWGDRAGPRWDTGPLRGVFDVNPAAAFAEWFGAQFNDFFARFNDAGQGPLPGRAGFGVLISTPVPGAESSPYGYRRDPINGRRKLHKGIDYKGKHGTDVRAAGAGIVVYARRRGSYGRLIAIDHGMGLETRYAHLRRIRVREGDYVHAGQVIGAIGSSGRTTGPHLHFEVRQHGEPVNPRWALGEIPHNAIDGAPTPPVREPDTASQPLADQLAAMLGWLR